MARIISIIEQLGTWRGLSVLVAVASLVFALIFTTLAQITEITGGYGILDFEVGYSVARVDEILGSYGAEGMALYRRIQLLDVINPAVYSLILACVAYLLWQGRGPRYIALIPLLGGVGDYLENVTLFLIVRSYPVLNAELITVSSSLSYLKNILAGVGGIVLLAGLWVFVVSKMRKGGSN
jgi:hypothetical protein